jgi:hypothetical protein
MNLHVQNTSLHALQEKEDRPGKKVVWDSIQIQNVLLVI